jgi:hypothetical protein
MAIQADGPTSLFLSSGMELKVMADIKDKMKDKIDQGAEKAKEMTEKAVDKTKEGAKAVGNKVKDAGQQIKNRAK